MKAIPVIAIFDVGKTNKKLLLFNEAYEVVLEQSVQLAEIIDEDGFPCEDVFALSDWVRNSFNGLLADSRFTIRAVQFSAYGASFVYIDEEGNVIPPLYNYLKPYPDYLRARFYQAYGGESLFAKQTASPVLGHLNSGMQLYWLKYERPEVFARIKYALHLPQFLSYLLTGTPYTDITSVGCHTNLWHFQKQDYHDWVTKEGIREKLAPLKDNRGEAGRTSQGIPVGVGLHDSSAALIPYLASFQEPFVLLSTGTWCISLNPFNHSQLSDFELHQDCLCYLAYDGKPVKASRLFAGYEHEQQVKRLAEHFHTALNYYQSVEPDPAQIENFKPSGETNQPKGAGGALTGQSLFAGRDLHQWQRYEQAYHVLMADIAVQQFRSTNLVLKGTPVRQIFVDGGFGRNAIFMQLLALAFPGIRVYAASVPQATALGAALGFHNNWNTQERPRDLVKLDEVPFRSGASA